MQVIGYGESPGGTTGTDGVYRTDAGSLADWMKLPPISDELPADTNSSRVININTRDMIPVQPGLFDTVVDIMKGAASDALDPLQVLHRSDVNTTAPAGTGTTSMQQLFGNFGKSFGNMLGIAVLVGIGYLVFKNEMKSKIA